MNNRHQIADQSRLTFRCALLLLLCFFFVSAGCSKPIDPPSAEEAEKNQQQESTETIENKKEPAEKNQEDEKTSGKPGENSGTFQGNQTFSGTSSSSISDKPKTAEEASRRAEEELSRSEKTSDLNESYQHASRAYQFAILFPKDKKSIAIADAALGRLRELEKKGIRLKEIGTSKEIDGKTIIESL